MATAPRQTRSNLQPENVDDGNHGQGRDGGDAADRDDGDGIGDELSAEEMAALSGMRTGERDAAGREEPDSAGDQDGDGDGEHDGDADADGVDDDAAAAAAADRDQGAGDDRGQQGDKSQQRAPKTINYGRHQRELGKRDTRLKELETALDTERQKSTRLDERTRMLLDAINARPKAEDQQQQQEDADPEPDKGEDPIGWSEWKIRKLEAVVTRLDGAATQDRQRTQEQTEEQREIGDYTAELQAAAQADETVGAAFVHLRESRYAELGAIYAGIDVNDPEQCATLTPQQQVTLSNQIQTAFASEQRLVYRAAKQSNRKVGQSILALAKARGFNPAAARQQEQQQDGDGAQDDQGRRRAAPAARQRAPVVPQRQQQQRSVSDEIDNIRDAAGASKSLSDAGGSPGGAVDLARLNEMDDDEFQAFLSDIPKNKLDRIMGK